MQLINSEAVPPRQQGFSLLELLVVIAVMTTILGVVFSQIDQVQQRYKTEESRLDIQQSSREFLDQMIRDLHTAGYPDTKMYTSGQPASGTSSSMLSAGIVMVSATDLLFEGDPEGDGKVKSIRYQLTNSGGNCPCTLSRSDINKVNGTAPASQGTSFAIDLQNVINSTGTSTNYPIAGNTRFAGVSNDTYYSTYKNSAVFSYFDVNSNAITVPDDLSSSANQTAGAMAAASVAQVNIVLNVLAPKDDLKTGVRPAVSMRAQVKINNF